MPTQVLLVAAERYLVYNTKFISVLIYDFSEKTAENTIVSAKLNRMFEAVTIDLFEVSCLKVFNNRNQEDSKPSPEILRIVINQVFILCGSSFVFIQANKSLSIL